MLLGEVVELRAAMDEFESVKRALEVCTCVCVVCVWWSLVGGG
jgi:hypothetical protein